MCFCNDINIRQFRKHSNYNENIVTSVKPMKNKDTCNFIESISNKSSHQLKISATNPDITIASFCIHAFHHSFTFIACCICTCLLMLL